MEKRTSLFENSLIWFGAGISIAEILTGTYFSSLGLIKGLSAIIIGHIIGCFLLFLAGIIGGKSRISSMETVKLSFGQKGGLFFSILNILQLLGWTAIMIYDGSLAANEIFGIYPWIWCVIIGVLIIVWVLIGITNLGKINTIAMSALFLLTIVLFINLLFKGNISKIRFGETLSFGAAIELAVAMPLSWLPLINDYTKEAKKPVTASLVSAITYCFISSWMYIIGMGASLFTGENEIAQIFLKAGLGIVGLIIVVCSTVTTTFMDAWSTGVSFISIFPKCKIKLISIGATVLGTLCAIIFPMDNIAGFLYLIGSVFAPMIAIQITDFFILKRPNTNKNIDIQNFIIWILGFVIYRLLMTVDLPIGNTIPDMVITMILCLIFSLFTKKKN